MQKILDNDNYFMSRHSEFNTSNDKAGSSSKSKRNTQPVSKLSVALQQYKTDRIESEDSLINCIRKVNLDKSILFKEK